MPLIFSINLKKYKQKYVIIHTGDYDHGHYVLYDVDA